MKKLFLSFAIALPAFAAPLAQADSGFAQCQSRLAQVIRSNTTLNPEAALREAGQRCAPVLNDQTTFGIFWDMVLLCNNNSGLNGLGCGDFAAEYSVQLPQGVYYSCVRPSLNAMSGNYLGKIKGAMGACGL
jgi:hypothetical protein